MKKIIRNIFTFVAGAALIASCDINKPDVFDDANAFVAFDRTSISVSEDYSADGMTLKVPVTLASVAGIEENVSFRLVEGSAKEGVNYELVTTSGVLSFNAENRTRNIEIEIVPDGKFTGDLQFSIEFVSTNSVTTSAEDRCVITIEDTDHPLAALFGTYEISGKSLFNGNTKYDASISKDENDINKVWFTNLLNSGMSFYGTVDNDLTAIVVPFEQEATYGPYSVQLLGVVAAGDDFDFSGGTWDGTIVKDAEGKITGIEFDSECGIAGYVPGAGSLEILLPGVTVTKK